MEGSAMPNPPKTLDDLTPSVETADAASIAIRARLREAERRVRDVRRGKSGEATVHRLRTASRRAAAALDTFAPCLPERRRKHARSLLKRVRRAAGVVRDLDVREALWEEIRSATDGVIGVAARSMIDRDAERRAIAIQRLRRAVTPETLKRLRRARRRLTHRVHPANLNGRTLARLGEFAPVALGELTEALREAIECGDRSPPAMHRARIEVKRLRYACELLTPCIATDAAPEIAGDLKRLHDVMGREHDLVIAIEELDNAVDAGDVWPEAGGALLVELDTMHDHARRVGVLLLEGFWERWLGGGILAPHPPAFAGEGGER